jgi:hypothetical protein
MSRTSFERMEELIRTIEAAPDNRLRAVALELMQAVLHLHGEALEKVLALCRARGDEGQEIIHEMTQDALIAGVLSLHDLHPESTRARVEEAVRRLTTSASSLGMEIELLGISEEGGVQLRVRGIKPSTKGVQDLIEDAVLGAAPEVSRVSIEGLPAKTSPAFVPITSLVMKAGAR